MTEPFAIEHNHPVHEIKSVVGECPACDPRLFNSWIRNVEVGAVRPLITDYVTYRGVDGKIGWRLSQEALIDMLNDAIEIIAEQQEEIKDMYETHVEVDVV